MGNIKYSNIFLKADKQEKDNKKQRRDGQIENKDHDGRFKPNRIIIFSMYSLNT